jgi:hypothetical protein
LCVEPISKAQLSSIWAGENSKRMSQQNA